MTLPDAEIREYFASSTPWLWEWRDSGTVLAWATGETIAFRPQIETVFARLVSPCPPPFGAIVLVLAACLRSWREERLGETARAECLRRCLNDSAPLVEAAFDRLDRIHFVRREVDDSRATEELAAIVLEQHEPPASLVDQGGTLLQALRAGLTPAHCVSFAPGERPGQLFWDLAPLAQSRATLDADTLRRRLATGLDAFPSAAPVDPLSELEASEDLSPRELMQRLEDDPELGGVARLARRLLAAVQLPRPLEDPQDLPLGGVSDLSNRGALDRLLLGELAHDDLTLAVRVAMNEALYLRREPLARPRARRRHVLIDAGVRMWGVPRTYAAATALAIAADESPKLDVTTWRTDGDSLCAVDLRTTAGLTALLAALDTRPHPGAALARFAEVAAADSDDGETSSESLIVTTGDVVNDPEFRQALDASGLATVHVAAVERDGRFELLQRGRGGWKSLRTARFDLDDLFRDRPPSPRLLDGAGSGELPAIFAVEPFPLLLSHPVQTDNSWLAEQVFTLTGDGRLLHWESPKRGPRQLLEGLPEGKLRWFERDGDHLLFVAGKASRTGLYVIQYSLETGERSLRRLELPREQPREVLGRGGVLFVTFDGMIAVCDRWSGVLLDYIDTGRPTRGRIFSTPAQTPGACDWYAYLFDGQRLRSTLAYRHEADRSPVVHVVDPPDGEPFGISVAGEQVELATGRRTRLPLPPEFRPCRIEGASRDGKRVLFGATSTIPAPLHLFDLAATSGQPHWSGRHEDMLERPLLAMTTASQLRNRFASIGVDGDGRLTLVTPRGRFTRLEYSSHGQTLLLVSRQDLQPLVGEPRPFERWDVAWRGRTPLHRATWPDGSRAVLDGRGLLHLRSSLPNLPELTIVLSDGLTTGWTSDGRCWGRAYFTGLDADLPADAVYFEVLQRFLEQVTASCKSR